MRTLGSCSGAAIRAREDFEQVPVGVQQVDAAAVVPVVDGVRLVPVRVGRIRQTACLDAAKDGIGFVLADEEGVVLRVHIAVGGHEIER